MNNARSGLGPVIDSYEAIVQFGKDIPQLGNKNVQAFFSTFLTEYPEQGQLLSIDLQSGPRYGINGVLRQLLRQEISSDVALYQLEEIFKVFVQ